MPAINSMSRFRVRFRLATVIAISAGFVAALALLGWLVAGAFGSMAQTADRIDDVRAVTAARGALESLQKTLSATVRDNAYWDDAYRQMATPAAFEWALDNWGSTTEDYPLYDTAMVINGDGTPLIAFDKGTTVDDPQAFYLGDLKPVLDAARRPDPNRNGLPVGFIRTKNGVAIIGAAAIQPSVFDPNVNYPSLKVLVFSKQLTDEVIADVSHTFTISGLRLLDEASTTGELSADLRDISGKRIAQFAWPEMGPGTASYLRVRPTVLAAGIGLLVMLAAIATVGALAFRAVKQGERLSDYKAKHDALTGLWNRAGLFEKLEGSLSRGGATTCLHLIDLDGFKPVNDAWGHAVGDLLIKAVARRLVTVLPASSVVARLGGDEFAVICDTDSSAKPNVVEGIMTSLREPFEIDGRIVEISGSLGTATAEPMACSATEMLRRADLALYRAKDLGRGTSVNYDPALDQDATNQAELEQELRQALAKGQVRTVFQPLIDATSRELRGLEALARWTSPTRGEVSPEIFIKVAEKAGLIDQLGFEILRTAIRQAALWQKINVAVNVSPLQLRNPYFATQVTEVLIAERFEPSRLTIEVTEGVLISNPDQAKRTFAALRQIGVKIALDDFGCGFASIGALREFGFDRMKIDRSLILALDNDDRSGAVLAATIALANALHLPVTAEGIETEAQAAAVRLSGCDELQGYLFGKPTESAEIEARFFGKQPALLAS